MGLSAAEDRAVDFSRAEQCGVLVTSIALVLLTIPLARCAGMAGAAALESIAGWRSVRPRWLPGASRVAGPLTTSSIRWVISPAGDIRPR